MAKKLRMESYKHKKINLSHYTSVYDKIDDIEHKNKCLYLYVFVMHGYYTGLCKKNSWLCLCIAKYKQRLLK